MQALFCFRTCRCSVLEYIKEYILLFLRNLTVINWFHLEQRRRCTLFIFLKIPQTLAWTKFSARERIKLVGAVNLLILMNILQRQPVIRGFLAS